MWWLPLLVWIASLDLVPIGAWRGNERKVRDALGLPFWAANLDCQWWCIAAGAALALFSGIYTPLAAILDSISSCIVPCISVFIIMSPIKP
jgi:hypothetical protein